MKGILADVNIEGHWQALLAVLQIEPWQEFWLHLNLTTPALAELGLAKHASDQLVWQTCQRHQLILVTANRNAKGSDSLEETLRTLNAPDSLPVLTLADPDRILQERSYAVKTAMRVLDILMDMDRCRGAGRLYVP